MKTRIAAFICLFILAGLSKGIAQVAKNGYNGITWGTEKSKIQGLNNCNASFAGKNYENCSVPSDSLLLGKFPMLFLNYRFYQDKLVEVNIDIDRAKLAYVVAELTMKYGSPAVREKMDDANNRANNFTFYEWTYGDSRIVLFDKGMNLPVWCTISSLKYKKMIKTGEEDDIQKLLFAQ